MPLVKVSRLDQLRELVARRPLLAAGGSVSAPSYSFSANRTDGFYQTAANELGLAFNGAINYFWGTSGFGILQGRNLRFSAGDQNANDLFLARDAANTFAQRNATNAQVFRVYRSFTDTSNFERAALNTAAGTVTLAAESAGTGGANLDIILLPKGTGRVQVGTALNTAVDGSATPAFTANMAVSTGGPTAAAQHGWMMLKDPSGAVVWVPVWK